MKSWVAGLSFVFISAYAIAGGQPDVDQSAAPAQVEELEAVKQTTNKNNNAVRIYIDPKTGEIAEPPADVAADMAAQEQSQLSQSEDAPLETFTMPGGGVGVVLGNRFDKPVNISTGCDGEIVEQGHDVDVSDVNTDDCN